VIDIIVKIRMRKKKKMKIKVKIKENKRDSIEENLMKIALNMYQMQKIKKMMEKFCVSVKT
jgi:hypothetical protein